MFIELAGNIRKHQIEAQVEISQISARSITSTKIAKSLKCWSEWGDSNTRPLPPEDSALPG